VPSPSLGDFYPTGPAEWSLLCSARTAINMLERYGYEEALSKAVRFRRSYVDGSWGAKDWDFASSFLRRLRELPDVEEEKQEYVREEFKTPCIAPPQRAAPPETAVQFVRRLPKPAKLPRPKQLGLFDQEDQ
jgi:hypothetical protein